MARCVGKKRTGRDDEMHEEDGVDGDIGEVHRGQEVANYIFMTLNHNSEELLLC